ncbi:MAG: hypothetical protein SFV23_10360 [Planctomycetaceae bacterium]|nr:hypothetical protein [Planctomycetaceae bacterium]
MDVAADQLRQTADLLVESVYRLSGVANCLNGWRPRFLELARRIESNDGPDDLVWAAAQIPLLKQALSRLRPALRELEPSLRPVSGETCAHVDALGLLEQADLSFDLEIGGSTELPEWKILAGSLVLAEVERSHGRPTILGGFLDSAAGVDVLKLAERVRNESAKAAVSVTHPVGKSEAEKLAVPDVGPVKQTPGYLGLIVDKDRRTIQRTDCIPVDLSRSEVAWVMFHAVYKTGGTPLTNEQLRELPGEPGNARRKAKSDLNSKLGILGVKISTDWRLIESEV